MVHVCFVLFVFFFFKQKTAYEMRISVWSSDVCSSDLAVAGGAQALGVPAGLAVGHAADIVSFDLDHPSFAGTDDATLLDRWIFAARAGAIRSEGRRGGEGCVSKCRSRWAAVH